MITVEGTLFHLIIDDIRGDHIFTLNQLRAAYPDLYTRHAAKHHGREWVMKEPIPALECTWGDVVFLSPVDSTDIFAALARAGRATDLPPAATIQASRLNPENCIIRLMRHGAGGHYPDPSDEHDYLPFTTASLRAVSRVTVAAISRLENLEPSDAGLPWVDVPHILHWGAIPVTGSSGVIGPVDQPHVVMSWLHSDTPSGPSLARRPYRLKRASEHSR